MTEQVNKIGGIIASAPLFNGVSEAALLGIVKMLSDASYHFADDTATEWGSGGELVREAAAAINRHKLGLVAITALQAHLPQLVSLEMLVNAVLKDARK